MNRVQKPPMKSFDEKADEATPCVRIGNADVQHYRVTEAGLLPAEKIGNDDYPEYGDWLPCEALADGSGGVLGPRYLECPGALAKELAKHEADVGFEFRLATVEKGDDDVWTIEIEELND